MQNFFFFFHYSEKVTENFRSLSTMGLILALLQSLGASAAGTGQDKDLYHPLIVPRGM